MLTPENSIITVIDIQKKLVNATNIFNIEKPAFNLLNCAQALDIPIIITEQYPKGLGLTVDKLKKAASSAKYIEKTSFSALQTKEFYNSLKSTNRKQVIIFGIELHICVYQTICDLINEGYEVYCVKDACASRKQKDFDTCIELLKQKGAYITCSEIVLFELLKSSLHPKFKEIQSLIK